MADFVIPQFIFYIFISFVILIMAYAAVISFIFFSRWWQDIIIFLDAQNRFSLKYANVGKSEEINHNDGKYITKSVEPVPLNKSGRALFIYSENNPEPMILKHKSAATMDSKTIMSIVNNKLIQMLMSLQSSFMTLQYMITICSVISAVAGVFVALKVYGIIK